MGDTDTVVDYYNEYHEDSRLKRHPLEFLRTREIISRYLTRSPMSVLDAGGGTGAYSFWLAQLGHSVSLLDLTSRHIGLALSRQDESGVRLKSAVVGDARSLPYGENAFDLVLLMGPLYHLASGADRRRALSEAYRVLKPNGRLVAAYISRFASLVDGYRSDYVRDAAFFEIMTRDIQTGVHRNTSGDKSYFTDAYFHYSGEIASEQTDAGFKFEDLIAVESFAGVIPDLDEKIKDPEYLRNLLNIIRMVEREPTLFGMSMHFLGIGRKSGNAPVKSKRQIIVNAYPVAVREAVGARR